MVGFVGCPDEEVDARLELAAEAAEVTEASISDTELALAEASDWDIELARIPLKVLVKRAPSVVPV